MAILVLLSAGTFVACSDADPGVPGSTTIDVITPPSNGSVGYAQYVDFTIDCVGENDEFFGDTRVEGPFELTDEGRFRPNDLWRAHVDLPPGPCTIRVRAFDSDNQIICSIDENFDVSAERPTEIFLVIACSYSIPVPAAP